MHLIKTAIQLAVLLAITAVSSAEVLYTVTDLGDLGKGNTTPFAINDSGHVVGRSYTLSDGNHPFLWTPETGIQDLNPIGAGTAYDINNSGQIVGNAYNESGQNSAYIWLPDGGKVDLSDLGLGNLNAINDAGQVIVKRSADNRAGIWQDGSFSPLPLPAGINYASLYDINNSGQVLGKINGVNTLWDGESLTPLWYGESESSMNDHGVVVSSIILSPRLIDGVYYPEAYYPAIWKDGILRELDGARGGSDEPPAINNEGLVVGSSNDIWGRESAFLWTEATGMVDLNELVEMPSGDRLDRAVDINESGQILCSGWTNGVKAFLLTPIYARGDVNRDLSVSLADLVILSSHYGMADGASWLDGDCNYDGAITLADLTILATNFGQVNEPVDIPEPATLSLLTLGGLALIRRRK